MAIELIPIRGIEIGDQQEFRLLAISWNGRCPALVFLGDLEEREQREFKSLMKSLRIVGSTKRPITDRKHVVRGEGFEGTYEARAHTLNSRLLFFYHEKQAIFTNGHWKPDGHQATSFQRCYELMNIFLRHSRPTNCSRLKSLLQ